jgi:hypothetical protein
MMEVDLECEGRDDEDGDESIVEDGGELDWVVPSDSFDVTTTQPLARRPPNGWIRQCN